MKILIVSIVLFTIVSSGVANGNGTTVPTTTQPTPAPKPSPGFDTTSTTALNCSLFTSCSDCTDDRHCYWCGPSKTCLHYPKGKIIPKGCSGNKWFWKQCTIPGYVLIIVVPSVGGLLLLLCCCCIYCKCCRQSGRSWKKEEDRITQRRKDRQLKSDEKKADRQKRTDALRMKYGLLKSDDEEPLI